MNYPPPPAPDHIGLLSIFHYIWAALGLLGLLMIGANTVLLETFLSAEKMAGQPDAADVAQMMTIFRGILIFAGVFSLASMVLNFLAARWLKARRNRSFCIVVAAMNCLSIPLGTALGVFTIIVLSRDPVRDSFA